MIAKKQLFVPILIASMLNANVLYADASTLQNIEIDNTENLGDVIAPLKRNDNAPFAGLLLSPAAVSKLIVELQSIEDRIKIETDAVKQEEKALCNHELTKRQITFDTDIKILNASLEERENRIRLLNDELERKNKKVDDAVWIGVGFVGGVVATIATVYAVSSITK